MGRRYGWHRLPKNLNLGKYQINKAGQLRNKGSKYVLNKKPNFSGYIQISLTTDSGKIKNFFIHRLVALTFIPNPESKPEVDHINRVRDDNHVDNLRWATRCEQNKNRVCKGRKGISVYQIDIKTEEIVQKWDKIKDATEALNIHGTSIGQVCRGKYKHAGGFKWRFAEPELLDGEKWRYSDRYNVHISNLGRVKFSSGCISYGSTAGNTRHFVIQERRPKRFISPWLKCLFPKLRGKIMSIIKMETR
jgi:hypothetical protein